jgi:hypothetical protein
MNGGNIRQGKRPGKGFIQIFTTCMLVGRTRLCFLGGAAYDIEVGGVEL